MGWKRGAEGDQTAPVGSRSGVWRGLGCTLDSQQGIDTVVDEERQRCGGAQFGQYVAGSRLGISADRRSAISFTFSILLAPCRFRLRAPSTVAGGSMKGKRKIYSVVFT
jgi:hypothetical protein